MALPFRRSSSRDPVGLDLDGAFLAAVRLEGARIAQAASADLEPGLIRDGEVVDEAGLSDALKRFARDASLPPTVRLGVANQQIVVRQLELPELEAGEERDAAVRFLAAEAIAMPLEEAVLDYQVVGRTVSPEGASRLRVVVVAARAAMIDRLVAAVRGAGLRPEGIDLSAFALVRALGRSGEEEEERARVLCHLGGVTNLAVAVGRTCVFTRLLSVSLGADAAVTPAPGGSGDSGQASDVAAAPPIEAGNGGPPGARAEEPYEHPVAEPASAQREGEAPGADASGPDVPGADLPAADVPGPVDVPAADVAPGTDAPAGGEPLPDPPAVGAGSALEPAPAEPGAASPVDPAPGELRAAGPLDPTSADPAAAGALGPTGAGPEAARAREAAAALADEIRLSIDYYMGQPDARWVGEVVLSGPGSTRPGLADQLAAAIGMPVSVAEPLSGLEASGLPVGEDPHRHTVAAGLALGAEA